MIGFDEMLRRFVEIDAVELSRWVENRWVLPEREGGTFVFHEVDIARVQLILEVRREFSSGDDAMDLALGLLDQVYSLRRQMRRLCRAVESQPPEIREAIQRVLTLDKSAS